MAEPPAMYADLVRMEENVGRLLESKSELGMNLRRQKRELERSGYPANVRLRHGIVVDQVFEEVREGNYDLIVTGSSQARGSLRHYIMGDLTRSILNRSNVPVLVARAGPPKPGRTLWNAIKAVFWQALTKSDARTPAHGRASCVHSKSWRETNRRFSRFCTKYWTRERFRSWECDASSHRFRLRIGLPGNERINFCSGLFCCNQGSQAH